MVKGVAAHGLPLATIGRSHSSQGGPYFCIAFSPLAQRDITCYEALSLRGEPCQQHQRLPFKWGQCQEVLFECFGHGSECLWGDIPRDREGVIFWRGRLPLCEPFYRFFTSEWRTPPPKVTRSGFAGFTSCNSVVVKSR